MKHNIRYTLLCFLLIQLVFAACRPQNTASPDSGAQGFPGKGFFVVTEGNFRSGNAALGFFNTSLQSYSADVYKQSNGKSLGDVAQSMRIINGKGYIVVNNSGKVVEVDTSTCKETAVISGLQSPRYICPVTQNKAYVTDLYSNSIAVVDLQTHSVVKKIACSGWTEDLLMAAGKVFVTNKYKYYVYVVDPNKDEVTDSIKVNYAPNSLCTDKDGKLWVLCGGDVFKGYKGGLYKINTATNQIEMGMETPADESPNHLCVNKEGNTLFYIDKGVVTVDIASNPLTSKMLIDKEGRNLYALTVNPTTNDIYLADAIDYVQRSKAYVYSSSGVLRYSFIAGINTNGFCFR